jgi:heterodisulfide reductase subunit A-like polyferredoxin
MRTFGFKEIFYKQAREVGVQFCRYEPDRKPQVAVEGGLLKVTVFDQNLQAPLSLRADYLALSAAVRPHPDSREVAQLFKTPLDTDGFFLEAHLKLRPLDFSAGGLFLCGLAHSPKYAEESIAQARGAAVRAMGILSQAELLGRAVVASVDRDKCAVCLNCVRSCPFAAPDIDREAGKAVIDPARCQGCGICTGVCPMKAIELDYYRDDQLLAEIRAGLA